MNIDSGEKNDIRNSINRIEEILSTNIFGHQNIRHPLLFSAFIEICILLNDLLSKSKKYNSRISFADDLTIIPNKVEDITDAVAQVRNAVCHISSPLHLVDRPNRLGASFNVMYGKVAGNKIVDFIQSSDYADDVAFWFGVHRLYLNRHIIRAVNEVKANLLQSLDPLSHDSTLGRRFK